MIDETNVKYPVIVHGMYGVVLVPFDVFKRVPTDQPPTGDYKSVEVTAASVMDLSGLGIDVPDLNKIGFTWFKIFNPRV